MSGLETILKKLGSTDFWGYGRKPIPHELDAEVEGMLNLALTLPARDVLHLRNSLTEDQRRTLQAFAERQAALAVRTGSAETLAMSLDALLFQATSPLDTETLLVLVLPYDAAKRLNLDFANLLGSSNSRTGGTLDSELALFLARSEEDKSLESMGYAALSSGESFRYEQT